MAFVACFTEDREMFCDPTLPSTKFDLNVKARARSNAIQDSQLTIC